MEYWFMDRTYQSQAGIVASKLALYSKSLMSVVERTYKIPFSPHETKNILILYARYCVDNNTHFEKSDEKKFLSDPFFRFIVNNLINTENYRDKSSWGKKGLRDRVWVILSSLTKCGKHGDDMYIEWWRAESTQRAFEKFKDLERASSEPVPDSTKKQIIEEAVKKEGAEEVSTDTIKYVAAIGGGLLITKVLGIW